LIPTPASLARNRRRLDRHQARVDAVVERMRRGAALHQCFERQATVWRLSTAERMHPSVAKSAITRTNIVAVGDALFAGMSQTWRYLED